MEFLTGVKEKETTSVSEILSGDYVGKTVKMNGAVHNIRDMGEFAFVILRKAEGLVQCVYEEGKTEFDLKNLKEESAVEVTGVVELEERAPQDFELRLTGIRVLSEPAETMPIAINKWKMNTSLETRLSLRPVSLRNVRERAKIQNSGRHCKRLSGVFILPGLYRGSYSEDRIPRRRGRSECL